MRKLQHEGKGQKESNGFGRGEDEDDTLCVIKGPLERREESFCPRPLVQKRHWLKLLEENRGWDVRTNLSGSEAGK